MTPLIRSMMRSVIETGFDPTEMQWFDISAAKDKTGVSQDLLLECRPPFEKCLVLWAGETQNHERYEMLMMVVGTDPEEGILIDMSKGTPGNMVTYPTMVYVVDGGVIRYGAVDENDVLDEDAAKTMLAILGSWYASLSKGTEAHSPYVRPTFTNRRKIAEGKTPSYEWNTVYIEAAQSRREHQGGAHASPRQHDRRGHLRRLRSGKNVWVRACKVGDASKGAVFHDYAIKEVKC